jgi:adenine-specific DNA-methyltransferase
VIKSKNPRDLELEFLVGILNSRLIFHWLYHKGKRKGDVLELFQVPLSEIPFPNCANELQISISALVQEITQVLEAPGGNRSIARVAELQLSIDKKVCEAYGLNSDEKDLILNS